MPLRAPSVEAFAKAVRRRIDSLRQSPDRGDVVGWALVVPLIMVLSIGGVQVAMWFHARICQAAAQTGARTARVLNAPANAGRVAAVAFLSTVGQGSVHAPTVNESRTQTAVTVTCSGHALRVIPIPGLSIAVTQSSSAERERFTTP